MGIVKSIKDEHDMRKAHEAFGAEQLRNSQSEYRKDVTPTVREVAEKHASRIKKAHEWHMSKWKAHPAQMFVTEGTALGLGLSGMAAVASTQAVLHGTKKGVRKAYDGMSLMDNSKNWVKYAGLSEFQDHDNGLNQQRYQYYSNVKFQHLDRNSRDTVLSWFGIDNEYKPTDFQAQDAAKDDASFKAEQKKDDAKQQMKEAEKRRREMFLPNVISMSLMRLMQDPYFRDYITRHQYTYDDPESDADVYGMENAIPYEHTHKNQQPHYAEADNASGRHDRGAGHDGQNNGGQPDGPLPLGPDGGNSGETFGLPYDEELNWNHFVDPNVAYARAQIENEMKLGLVDFHDAYNHSREGWKDMDNEILVSDIQTLHDYGKLDRMMKGIECGEVCTIEDLQNVGDSYEQTWAEIEEKGIMPLYGDRINDYMNSLNLENNVDKSVEPIVQNQESLPSDKDVLKQQILQSRMEAKEAIGMDVKSDRYLDKNQPEVGIPVNSLDVANNKSEILAKNPEVENNEPTLRDVLKSAAFANTVKNVGKEVIRRKQEQMKTLEQPAIEVESTVIEKNEAKMLEVKDTTEKKKDNQRNVVEMQQDISEYGEVIAGRDEDAGTVKAHEEEKIDAKVAITTDGNMVESKPRNNGYIPSSIRDVVEAAEIENETQYE